MRIIGIEGTLVEKQFSGLSQKEIIALLQKQ